jgi:uridine phosphorylase
MAERKYHVGLTAEEVGKYVLYPGDPARTAVIGALLESAREVAFSREYRTFTGMVTGVPVSAISSGMGGPSVAVGMEELRELGVHTFLRVGTCGATQPEVKMGDLVIASGAVRTEGTGDGYVPKEFPAVADHEVVTALVASAHDLGAPYHLGIVRAVDALYSDLVPDTMPNGAHLREELAMWARAGVLANDMETSTLFVVASVRRLRAGSLLLCVDEVGAGEIHHLDPSYMERMLKVAIGAIRQLIERDAARK